MPELPEVETVVRDLRPVLVDRSITGVRQGEQKLRRSSGSEWSEQVIGQRIVGVLRRGKWIRIELETGRCLLIHLGMTGQLTVVSADEPVSEHTHLCLMLDKGQELRFRDVRRFGSVSYYPDASAVEAFFRSKKLGPEPFSLDKRSWREALKGTTRAIKSVLLDQSVVAGVGNIYADESLFVARIHPLRPACDLTMAEADRLREALVSVLKQAIKRRGSTIRDYIGGSGLRGGYQEEFRVYGRKGEGCLRCQTPLAVLRISGRSSHYCPHCQPFEVRSERKGTRLLDSPRRSRPKAER